MFPVSFDAPPPPPQATWQAQETVREVDHRPHLLVRLTVRGGHFPHRALVPFMRIVDDDKVIAHAWFTEISGDSTELAGYFVTDLSGAGVIEFGYDEVVQGRVPIRFDAKDVKRLERNRLEKGVVETTREYLTKKGR